jgi:hypothetical protein
VDDVRHDDQRASDRPISTADLAGQSDKLHAEGRTVDDVGEREATAAPLLPDNEADDLRKHWEQIQIGFVDEPRRAVEEADQLVASAMTRLAEVFASERSRLESQWDRGDDVSTEDLRVALRRYRSFFERLLSV